MKNKKFLSLFLVLTLIITGLVGCSGKEDQETGGEPVDEGQVSNGLDSEQYLNFILDAEPSTLDPSKGSDMYSNSVLVNVMEPLTRLEEDENQNTKLVPAGAEEWEVSEDGLVWTFKLRENYWSDGEKVTAQDYEYGIKRSADPNTASPFSFLLTPIKNAEKVIAGELPVDELGVKALDENTLEITLEYPTPYFEQLTYQRVMFAQRKDIVEQYGDTFGTEPDTLVYNGPFVVSQWIHNSEVILTKNPSYWDADSVNLETVSYKIIEDRNSAYNSLANRSVDQASVNDPDWLKRFSEDENLNHIEVVRPSVNYVFFNTQDELFQNANVRKAFSLAIDREEIAEVIFNGVHVPAYGWTPPSVLIGEDEYRAKVDEPLRAIKEQNPDPKELLIKGLEELGMDTNPENLDVTFSLGGTDQWFRTFGEYIQQVFKKNLGVEVKIEQLEWPIFDSNVNKGEFQIGYIAWTADYNDPSTMMNLLESTSTAIRTGWKNERYDELIRLAGQELDHGKRLEYYKEAEEILMDESPVAPVVFAKTNVFRYKYVNNVGVTDFNTQGFKYGFTQGR